MHHRPATSYQVNTPVSAARRILSAATLFLTSLFSATAPVQLAADERSSPKQPNIVLILVDDKCEPFEADVMISRETA
jgi:hypothetical protein